MAPASRSRSWEPLPASTCSSPCGCRPAAGRSRSWLLPEPENPYDGNAVAVVVASQVVGYLSRTYAALWQPVVLEELAVGRVVTGQGRLLRRRGRGISVAAEVVQPAPCLPSEPPSGLPLPVGLEALPRLWPACRPQTRVAALRRGMAARRVRRAAALDAAYGEWALQQVRRRRRSNQQVRLAAARARARRGSAEQWTRTVPHAAALLLHHLAQCPLPFVWQAEMPLGIWRLDLFCEHAMLNVEVDGPEHRRSEQQSRDRQRDEELRRLGVATLRVTNDEVVSDPARRRRGGVQARLPACRRVGPHRPAVAVPRLDDA